MDGQKSGNVEIPFTLWDKMFLEFLPSERVVQSLHHAGEMP
jgi:hypothetical protein